MNLQSILILGIILGLFIYTSYRQWQQVKKGQAPCNSCTVTDCPLQGLSLQANSKMSGGPACCQAERPVTSEERARIQAQIQARLNQQSLKLK